MDIKNSKKDINELIKTDAYNYSNELLLPILKSFIYELNNVKVIDKNGLEIPEWMDFLSNTKFFEKNELRERKTLSNGMSGFIITQMAENWYITVPHMIDKGRTVLDPDGNILAITYWNRLVKSFGNFNFYETVSINFDGTKYIKNIFYEKVGSEGTSVVSFSDIGIIGTDLTGTFTYSSMPAIITSTRDDNCIFDEIAATFRWLCEINYFIWKYAYGRGNKTILNKRVFDNNFMDNKFKEKLLNDENIIEVDMPNRPISDMFTSIPNSVALQDLFKLKDGALSDITNMVGAPIYDSTGGGNNKHTAEILLPNIGKLNYLHTIKKTRERDIRKTLQLFNEQSGNRLPVEFNISIEVTDIETMALAKVAGNMKELPASNQNIGSETQEGEN